MTYKHKYKENKRLIEGYSAYLFAEKIPGSGVIGLINEIARLDAQNRAIEEMSFKRVEKDNHDYSIEIPSKL